jgi:hypothetical protein
MDRNIITEADVISSEAGIRGADGFVLGTPDDRFQKLLKFIPSESIGLYIGLDGIIRSAGTDSSRLRLWLGILLVICVLFTWLYLRRFWHVTRVSQVAVSTVALIAYVFAIGGVFREFAFYKPWESSFVLVLITAFLAFFDPPGAAGIRTSAPRTSGRVAKAKP